MWRHPPLGELQALPVGATPVTEWNNQDAAFENVVQGIQKVLENLSRTSREEVQQKEGRRKPEKPHLTFAQLKRWYVVIPLILVLLGGSLGVYGAATDKWPWSQMWTLQHLPDFGSELDAITWSGSQFVAVGWNGAILTSPDGSTWTAQRYGSLYTEQLHAVIWSGSQFVAVGYPGAILTSPDGQIWTAPHSSSSKELHAIAWSGLQFVAVGYPGTILTSPNGQIWTAQHSSSLVDLHAVVWSGSQFVAVGNSGTILTSPDGQTWINQHSSSSDNLYAVAWSGSQFVAVGGNLTTSTLRRKSAGSLNG